LINGINLEIKIHSTGLEDFKLKKDCLQVVHQDLLYGEQWNLLEISQKESESVFYSQTQ
jgi:hypothetical protein